MKYELTRKLSVTILFHRTVPNSDNVTFCPKQVHREHIAELVQGIGPQMERSGSQFLRPVATYKLGFQHIPTIEFPDFILTKINTTIFATMIQ